MLCCSAGLHSMANINGTYALSAFLSFPCNDDMLSPLSYQLKELLWRLTVTPNHRLNLLEHHHYLLVFTS